MLVNLMYHRVRAQHLPLSLDVFKRHLTDLKKNYHTVIPGETLNTKRVNVCLTFDDAYYDFYHDVFPLLKQLNIKAVLAIPSALIPDSTKLNATKRLELSFNSTFDPTITSNPALCTWDEIQEMVDSQLVVPASHGATHVNLLSESVILKDEIAKSKQTIEEKLNTTVSTFVYPFGRTNKNINHKVTEYYKFAMRIGSAINIKWSNPNGLLYRIDADNYWPFNKDPCSLGSRIYHSIRYFNNKMLGK